MFEQTFKNIDNILWKDAGCSTELDYAEQSSWILFLKWLDDYEKEKENCIMSHNSYAACAYHLLNHFLIEEILLAGGACKFICIGRL